MRVAESGCPPRAKSLPVCPRRFRPVSLQGQLVISVRDTDAQENRRRPAEAFLPMEWPLGANSRRSGTRHTRFRSNLSKRTLGGSRLVVSQVATSGLMRCGKKASSFDHLVGAPKQRDRESEAERPGGLEVDKQLNFRGLLHREVRGFDARKNQAGMDTALMPPISNTTSVAHEAAGRSEFAKLVDRGHAVANGERGKPFAMACEE